MAEIKVFDEFTIATSEITSLFRSEDSLVERRMTADLADLLRRSRGPSARPAKSRNIPRTPSSWELELDSGIARKAAAALFVPARSKLLR